MAGSGVSISLGAGDREAVKLNEVALAHHLGSAVRLDVPTLNGGNVLRLAVATCVFNVIMRMAEEDGITLTSLDVTADGDLGGSGPDATGLRYDVDVTGDASDERLRDLVDRAGWNSPVGLALPPGIPVTAGDIQIHSGV